MNNPMRFQARDGEILRMIYHCDGVLAKRQIKNAFWPNKTARAMEKRLAKLKSQGYLEWPDPSQWHAKPIPEPVCWLGWKGACYIAGLLQVDLKPLMAINESQKRRLQRALRNDGIRWRREPRWDQLDHDLTIVDFRLSVERSVGLLERYSLDEWIHEGEFRADTDVVEFEIESRHGELRRHRRGVCPDSCFVIIDEEKRMRGEDHKARFLLEVDMATHETSRFGIEKAAAGAAYVRSRVYRERFGYNAGIWLVVTSSEARRRNLMRQTVAKAGADSRLFYFTTLANLEGADLFASHGWKRASDSETVSLLSLLSGAASRSKKDRI